MRLNRVRCDGCGNELDGDRQFDRWRTFEFNFKVMGDRAEADICNECCIKMLAAIGLSITGGKR